MENEEENQEIQPKPKIKIAIISIILIMIVLLIARYITNEEFRRLIDIKFLGKQVTENTLNSIEINSEDNPFYFAFNDYIGIIVKNKLSIYDNKGNLDNSFSIDISNPIVDTNNKFVVIAEKNGNKFYVVHSTTLLFSEKIDEKIHKISINQNGYVSIIASNSTYKSIIIVYDNHNTELFKTFLRSTYAMCANISDTNNYIALGEINYSGTVIKSTVKIIDRNTAKTTYEFNNPENEILTNIVYGNNDIATCSFSNSIYQITPTKATKIHDINEENPFINIDMKNILAIIERESSGLFSYDYKLKLKDISSETENIYFLNNGLPKSTIAKENYIVLNYGNQISIINKKGTLKKSYLSTQQIKDVIIGNHICGVIYKDKIELIPL